MALLSRPLSRTGVWCLLQALPCPAPLRALPAPSDFLWKLLLSGARRVLAAGGKQERTEAAPILPDAGQGWPGCLGIPSTGSAVGSLRCVVGTASGSVRGNTLLGTLSRLFPSSPGQRAGAPLMARGCSCVDNKGKLTSGRVRTLRVRQSRCCHPCAAGRWAERGV